MSVFDAQAIKAIAAAVFVAILIAIIFPNS